MVGGCRHRGVIGEHLVAIALGLQNPEAEFRLIGAQHQDRIVELARHLEGPELGAPRPHRLAALRSIVQRRGDSDCRKAARAVEAHVDQLIMITLDVDDALERRQLHTAGRCRRPLRLAGERLGTRAHGVNPASRRRNVID